MCNLFALNFVGPNYRTIKIDLKKGVQFSPGKHPKIIAKGLRFVSDFVCMKV